MADSVWITPRARQDIVDSATFIGRENVDAANRFFDQFDQLCDLLATTPEVGSQFPVANPRLQGMRVLRVPTFPNHLAFFSPVDGGVQIVRVLHGARDLDAVFGQK